MIKRLIKRIQETLDSLTKEQAKAFFDRFFIK